MLDPAIWLSELARHALTYEIGIGASRGRVRIELELSRDGVCNATFRCTMIGRTAGVRRRYVRDQLEFTDPRREAYNVTHELRELLLRNR